MGQLAITRGAVTYGPDLRIRQCASYRASVEGLAPWTAFERKTSIRRWDQTLGRTRASKVVSYLPSTAPLHSPNLNMTTMIQPHIWMCAHMSHIVQSRQTRKREANIRSNKNRKVILTNECSRNNSRELQMIILILQTNITTQRLGPNSLSIQRNIKETDK